VRRVLVSIALAAGPLLVACGDDSSTSGASPVIAESAGPLLVDSLPELTGPTVLWFWAPG
jgi:hypothetical protein